MIANKVNLDEIFYTFILFYKCTFMITSYMAVDIVKIYHLV